MLSSKISRYKKLQPSFVIVSISSVKFKKTSKPSLPQLEGTISLGNTGFKSRFKKELAYQIPS